MGQIEIELLELKVRRVFFSPPDKITILPSFLLHTFIKGEYQDVETAQSAMRNLNNYDFNGRPLR